MENEPAQETEKPGQELADILSSYGEELGFDPETCQEVAGMTFEDAFETTYSYLTSSGLDADQILASFTEEPQK